MMKSPTNRVVVVDDRKRLLGVISPKDLLAFLIGESRKSLDLKAQLANAKDKSKLVATPKHKINDAIERYTTTINVAEQVSFTSKGLLRGRKFDYFKGFDFPFLFANLKQICSRW